MKTTMIALLLLLHRGGIAQDMFLTMVGPALQGHEESPSRLEARPEPLEIGWIPVEVRTVPNPFSEWLEVVLKADFEGQLEIRLYDPQRREVLHFRTRPGETAAMLPTAALPAGFYVLTVAERRGRLLATRSVEKA